MTSKLIERRLPTRSDFLDARGTEPEIIFIRRDEDGAKHVIYGTRVYEGWSQWGAPANILSDNCVDIDEWRGAANDLYVYLDQEVEAELVTGD